MPSSGKLFRRLKISKKRNMLMRSDETIGMGLSQLVMWEKTTAATPNANNTTNIQTADQDARALQPLAKPFPASSTKSKTIFAFVIIGTELLKLSIII
jgi:hypothetical protein